MRRRVQVECAPRADRARAPTAPKSLREGNAARDFRGASREADAGAASTGRRVVRRPVRKQVLQVARLSRGQGGRGQIGPGQEACRGRLRGSKLEVASLPAHEARPTGRCSGACRENRPESLGGFERPGQAAGDGLPGANQNGSSSSRERTCWKSGFPSTGRGFEDKASPATTSTREAPRNCSNG